MALATLTARVSAQDKSAFDSFCNSVGINTSTAINIFVKKVLAEHRIPFEISSAPKTEEDSFYSPYNQAYVLKSIQELREGKGKMHELIEV